MRAARSDRGHTSVSSSAGSASWKRSRQKKPERNAQIDREGGAAKHEQNSVFPERRRLLRAAAAAGAGKLGDRPDGDRHAQPAVFTDGRSGRTAARPAEKDRTDCRAAGCAVRWRKALPLLLTAIVCTPASVPWLACAVGRLFPDPAGRPALPESGQRLNREEKRLVFCCAVAAVSVCSLSSPLYAFNTWVDANCFMTVGKSMLYGLVPYRDLYEQKGPLLYAMYALCYLISHRSFLGAWLLEAAAAFCFLLYACRCFLLFHEKLSPIFLFLTAALTRLS